MEITEKWLGDIGGWAAMKAARSLVDAGMAVVTSVQGGLVRGTAGSGKMKFTTGLRIRSKSDVDNLCTCPHARRSGMICEHALAVALAHVREQNGTARPVATPASPAAAAPKPAHASSEPPSVGTHTVPGRYSVYLPEGLWAGTLREPCGVFVKFEPGGEPETSAFAAWLAGQGVARPQSVPVSLRGAGLLQFLATLPGHPRVFVGKPNGQERPLHVAPELMRLPLLVEESSAGQVTLSLNAASERPVLPPWWVCPETSTLFRHLAELPEMTALAADLGRGGKTARPLRWLVEHCGRLEESFQLELRGEHLARFHVVPVPCELVLQVDGSLQAVELRVEARFGDRRWPVLTRDAPQAQVAGGAPPLFPIQDEQDGHMFYTQNTSLEGTLRHRLAGLGFQPDGLRSWRMQGGERVLQFFASDLPLLQELGTIAEGEKWRSATRGLQRIRPQTRFDGGDGQARSSGEWLTMEFAYEAGDGFRLPRAEVLRLIRSGQRSVQGKNGRRYILDAAAVNDLEESLRDVPLELTPEGARVQGVHAAYFAGQRFEPTPVSADEVRAEISDLAALLRPYQMEGVCWMTSRTLAGQGGVLADEMGLGKTVQSIAVARILKHRNPAGGPVLVVCPKSLLANWAAEFERFAPAMKVLTVQGAGREASLARMSSFDVVITSYQLIVRDLENYQKLVFNLVLLDEASFIRNPETEAAKTLRSLKCTRRIALTGTPLENGVRDLWSIFHFTLPGYLGTQSAFKERFEAPIQSGLDLPAGQTAAQRLQKLCQPYFLRRTKRQVLKDLPEKIEQVLWCTPSAAQAEFYRKILEEGREEIKAARRRSGQAGAKMTMFTVLLRLRQVCCDLRLTGIRPEALAGLEPDDCSGKWAALQGQIDSALESGGKVLVFSQFVQYLRLMREAFTAQKLDHAYLDGSSQDRPAQVERFQKDPNCRLFLISLKAGGYGLNLTAADHVILADPWWNPAVESQAIDRAHRFGQSRVVNAYRLAIRGTVEERILKLQSQKRGLVEATLNEQAPLMEGLSQAELEDLVA